MSDPRLTDPKWNDPVDPRLNDPVLRRDTNGDGAWGWIAGVAVLLLIGFILVAGWNSSGDNTAANNQPPVTTGSTPMRNVTPPSTTGSGSTSPMPPSPSAAPANPTPSFAPANNDQK
jgi:hypothetical protein